MKLNKSETITWLNRIEKESSDTWEYQLLSAEEGGFLDSEGVSAWLSKYSRREKRYRTQKRIQNNTESQQNQVQPTQDEYRGCFHPHTC